MDKPDIPTIHKIQLLRMVKCVFAMANGMVMVLKSSKVGSLIDCGQLIDLLLIYLFSMTLYNHKVGKIIVLYKIKGTSRTSKKSLGVKL